jgi:hypothetical protein
MAYTSLSLDARRPMNRWNHDRIQPGPVGSVGDVNCQVRLKHSSPDMPLRWEPVFAGNNQPFLGSNVQNGQYVSYVSGGAMARVNDSNWQSGRSFKTRLGWVVEDITAPDNLVEPFVSSLGDYTWRDKIATVYEARRTGAQFLPLPGKYQLSPGEFPRGGNTVRVTDIIGGDIPVGDSPAEAAIPIGAYGKSQGLSQDTATGGEYSARLSGQTRGSEKYGTQVGLGKRL